MVRLARDLWPAWCGDRPLPDDEGTLVRGVLDAVAAEHPKADDLLDFCREENARIEAFCTRARPHRPRRRAARDPAGRRSSCARSAARCSSSPGPLDKGQKAFFAITPMPDDWSEEQRESYLREDNDRMLRLLTHPRGGPRPLPPGRLRQPLSRRSPRAIFGSGLFAEGWAVYVTQVMMDVGYGADDPALLLTHWKFYLRSITNAIIDARIHCDGMTEDEAVALMVDGGFQEEAEARAKFDRARLSSTQLSTYFAGSMEMWDDRARGSPAAPGGRSPRSRPGGLPGGFGETPGFVYRDHLESVIAHGSPPTSLLRRILLGLATAGRAPVRTSDASALGVAILGVDVADIGGASAVRQRVDPVAGRLGGRQAGRSASASSGARVGLDRVQPDGPAEHRREPVAVEPLDALPGVDADRGADRVVGRARRRAAGHRTARSRPRIDGRPRQAEQDADAVGDGPASPSSRPGRR